MKFYLSLVAAILIGMGQVSWADDTQPYDDDSQSTQEEATECDTGGYACSCKTIVSIVNNSGDVLSIDGLAVRHNSTYVLSMSHGGFVSVTDAAPAKGALVRTYESIATGHCSRITVIYTKVDGNLTPTAYYT